MHIGLRGHVEYLVGFLKVTFTLVGVLGMEFDGETILHGKDALDMGHEKETLKTCIGEATCQCIFICISYPGTNSPKAKAQLALNELSIMGGTRVLLTSSNPFHFSI